LSISVGWWQHRIKTGMPAQLSSNRPITFLRCCQPRHRPACITVTVLGFVIAAILLAFVAFGEDEPSHSTLRLVSVVS